MKRFRLLLIFIFLVPPVSAVWVTTPGAIAKLDKPDDLIFQYNAVNDISVFLKPQQTQITVSVLPASDPVLALNEVLALFNAAQYISQIKTQSIAGFDAAAVLVKQQTSDWLMVVKLPELNVFVRLQDAQNAQAHQDELEKLLQSIQFAPAQLPALVSGYYSSNSFYSGTSTGTDVSVYGESSVALNADGRFSTSAFTGVSGSAVSGYSQSEDPGGWWQVRGNRILAFEPPRTFYNYRFVAFSNGLELYNQANEKLLWVRK